MERISFFSSSSFPHFVRLCVSNVYLRDEDDDDEDDDEDDEDDDEKSFSLMFEKIHFF